MINLQLLHWCFITISQEIYQKRFRLQRERERETETDRQKEREREYEYRRSRYQILSHLSIYSHLIIRERKKETNRERHVETYKYKYMNTFLQSQTDKPIEKNKTKPNSEEYRENDRQTETLMCTKSDARLSCQILYKFQSWNLLDPSLYDHL